MVLVSFYFERCFIFILCSCIFILIILFNIVGMPKVLYFGNRGTENIMIMELLGPSIESLFNICERNFSVKTVCMIAKQLVSIKYYK